ncbi:a61d9bec-e3bf-442d-b4e4-6b924c418613 [Thermothielavioides terrestris]|uniref:A61d9bec-e3bf-442d-b4e4-6b924c418613 n=1 Tax=Thermothielavioides terrestris TaxID=2587410 RepID=A0A446B934_9PEZI|nr:a61d9bec-e3bf-442d-b4e4-6b924c418613 [Thermothielavioides terrestris]
MAVELDDFGLPVRKYPAPEVPGPRERVAPAGTAGEPGQATAAVPRDSKDSVQRSGAEPPDAARISTAASAAEHSVSEKTQPTPRPHGEAKLPAVTSDGAKPSVNGGPEPAGGADEKAAKTDVQEDQAVSEARKTEVVTTDPKHDTSKRESGVGVSGYSHQQLTSQQAEKEEDDDGGWQTMPAYAPYDIYDDNNKLIAKEYHEADDESYGYASLGGAGKGYTKVLLDDDAESATSMDENTQYLFKEPGGGTSIVDDDDVQRDAVSQLQATKELLTEGQRIAYVGITRLELSAMLQEAESIVANTVKAKKQVSLAAESMKMWGQKMMIRLYTHMDISPAEQVMIEQLSAHGVVPRDLTPILMANARVRNPMAADEDARSSISSPTPSRPASVASPAPSAPERTAEPPPPYSVDDDSELTAPVRTPSQMPTTQRIDIDIRWTVLCDLFLVLIADSIYDARSRTLLERVAKDLEISWLDICRFEKKVTDALEMQANAENENWNEGEHMENRRKMALKRRYMMMGLATVGGGLVIGLSAGLLAPVIGMGLAAGFATIGIGGTSGFLAGAGGAAIITSSAAASGGIIGIRAANRRTGAVKTFEYRPLHSNKRVNLIVTVSGWMTGKVDDVRLPFSTVDPVMGDIYSVLWEPEMLSSMGDTINILATEALTQGLQQLLGSTILVSLMAALQLPVVLTKLAYLIDNPWAVSLDRATMAGLILADSLIDRNLGTRPVTLVGYSLGSRVIFSCLQELARKGAFGLVQNVYLFGSPMVVKKDEYLRARTVVSGRFVNGYNRNDWILGYLFRLTNGGIRRVAGLAAIEDIPGVENMDVSEFVVGHMDYRTAMPRLMRECGWLVESDEFTEIEDPDPDNYRERQRELISEIEEARRELEKEGKGSKGGAFGFFKRKRAPQKQEWEVYEESKGAGKRGKTEDKEGNNHGVLFDVDAIRAEIAKENENSKDAHIDEELLQIKEIKSTLPPIKLDLHSAAGGGSGTDPGLVPPAKSARPHSLRETKSAEAIPSSSEDRSTSYYEPRSSHDQAGPSRERTPTLPTTTSSKAERNSPYHAYGYPAYGGNDGLEDDGIQMTFDTGFDDEPKPSASAPSAITGGASSAATAPARPEFKSAQTLPNITLADPWADDDDEEFGKEKEIQMTFA